MRHPLGLVLLPAALLAASTLSACATGDGSVARPTLRLDVTAADDFEVELSGLGYAAEAEAEYESFEVGVGATFYSEAADGSGQVRRSRAELVVGSVSVEDVDVVEVAGGGRFYLGEHPRIHPFLGVYAVGSYIEEIQGFDPGTQIGLRAGGGVELSLTDSVFFDAAVDYTLPIVAAESDALFGETAESELRGVALRVGIGFVF